MEAKWLEDFLSVARTGNFSQSASERHITQSAFSRRIKSLEQWVGVALIDRSTYPTRLTHAGEQFREIAREATVSLLQTRQRLRQALNTDRQLLRIAVQHSLAGNFLAQWLARLPLAQADTLVRARADNLHDCVRDLEEGNVDMLICYTHRDLPLRLDTERYPSLLMAEDSLIVLSKPDDNAGPLHTLHAPYTSPTSPTSHTMRATHTPQTSHLAPVSWLAYNADTFLGRASALAFAGNASPVALHSIFESALAEALRAAAVAGLGLAWLPFSLVADDVAHGRLVPAGGIEFDVPLQVRLYVSRSMLTGRCRNLWDVACDIARQSMEPSSPTES